jgi:hypothetical protein
VNQSCSDSGALKCHQGNGYRSGRGGPDLEAEVAVADEASVTQLGEFLSGESIGAA